MKNPLLVVDGRPVRYRHLQSTHYGSNFLYPLGVAPTPLANFEWQTVDGQWHSASGVYAINQRRSERLLIEIDTAPQ